MTDWAAIDFRKLYMVFATSFERLPFFVRGFGAEVLRRCDRQGRIVRGSAMSDAFLDDLTFHLRAHDSEREQLREAIRLLLADGYLVFAGGFLTIRNYAEAQKSTSAERMARVRLGRHGVTNVTSDKSDASDRSDKCDVEEKRREEIPPTPQGAPEAIRVRGVRECAIAGYEAGIRSVTGAPFVVPDDEIPALMRQVSVRWPQHRGEKLEAIVAQNAAAYCRENRTSGKFERGFRPSKWGDWLNANETPSGTFRQGIKSPEDIRTERMNAAQDAAMAAVGGAKR